MYDSDYDGAYVTDYAWDYDHGKCDCCGEVTYEFERSFGACLSEYLVVCSGCNGNRGICTKDQRCY